MPQGHCSWQGISSSPAASQRPAASGAACQAGNPRSRNSCTQHTLWHVARPHQEILPRVVLGSPCNNPLCGNDQTGHWYAKDCHLPHHCGSHHRAGCWRKAGKEAYGLVSRQAANPCEQQPACSTVSSFCHCCSYETAAS